MSRTFALIVGLALMTGSGLPASGRFGRLDELGAAGGPDALEIVTSGGPALFVVGSTTLVAGDIAVKNRLEGLGFSLTIKSSSSAQSGDADDKVLVFVSSTANAGSVNTKFRDVAVPVIVAQNAIFDDMKMTNTTTGSFGSTGSQTQVVIAASGDPLAAGLTGTPTVAAITTFAWGQVVGAGVKVANLTGSGNSNRATVFRYERDTAMQGTFLAPARRVGFFVSNEKPNTSGWNLFDAAVTWASNKTAAPYFSPWGGTFTSPPSVEMFCDTPGAQIRYTTNGSTPGLGSTLYTGPVAISTTTTLQARAFFGDWAPSDVAGDVYQMSYGTVADPVFTPNGGSGVDSVNVSISAEPGATIRYTTDGSNPEEWTPDVYTGPLTFTTTTELKARAFRTDYTPSSTVAATFHVTPPPPTLSLASGTYPLGQAVTVTAPAGGATLHYSIDGDEPTDLDPTVESGANLPVGTFTLKVNAWRPNQSPSASAEATYVTTGRLTNGAVAASSASSFALRPDGTVLAWGFGYGATPKLVNGLSNVKSMAPGLAVKADGTVWQFSGAQAPVQISGLSEIVAVAAGPTHSMALQANGVAWAWGSNADGQLGNGTNNFSATPVQVLNLTNIQAIAVGQRHSLAMTTDGYLWAWGYGGLGQIGDGFLQSRNVPTQVIDSAGGPFGNATGIGAGGLHSMARKSSGFWLWGSNNNGQVGGTPLNKALPSGGPGSVMMSLAGGTYHSVTATGSGLVCTLGDNLHGALGDGLAPTDRNFTYCLADPIPPNAPLQVVQVAAGIAGPSASQSHTLALTADGRIFAWGSNTYGQVGDGTTSNNRNTPVQVHQWDFGTAAAPTFSPVAGTYETPVTLTLSAEAGASIRYTLDGTTPFFDSPLYSAPLTISSTTTVKAIATRPDANVSSVVTGNFVIRVATPELTPTGGTFPTGGVPVTVSCATPGATIRYTFNGTDPTTTDPTIASGSTLTLTATGTLKVKAWKTGLDPSLVRAETYTVTGQPSGASIAAGGSHSLALSVDAAMWGWGRNYEGQLGDGTTGERLLPIPVTAVPPVSLVTAGSYHSAALYQSTVWSWGSRSFGQLGDGTIGGYSTTPAALAGLDGVTAVAAGAHHTLALRNDGAVWAWGGNTSGQIGDNSNTTRPAPVPVGGLTGVTIVAVSTSSEHNLAIDSLGRVWAWGRNSSGQIGDNTNAQRKLPVLIAGFGGATVVAVAAGGSHSLALTASGQVYAWGANDSGQLGDTTTSPRWVPTLLPNFGGVTAISAGGSHSLALKPTGVVWAWGHGAMVGDGAGLNRLSPVAVQGGLGGVSKISAGPSHSLALTHDGAVWAWGHNTSGQLGDGTKTNRPLPTRISGPNLAWRPATPSLSLAPGVYTLTAPPSVTLTCATAGATIHYTTNGSDPTESDPPVVSGGAVTVDQSLTLKARAFFQNLPPSEVATAAYELKVAAPTYTPPIGTYLEGQNVTFVSPTVGSVMHYTVNGYPPTEADPVLPPGTSLTLEAPTTYSVKAWRSGWTPSNVVPPHYGVRVAKPTLSPASGGYSGPLQVTASVTTADSVIHYTTDGREPTAADPVIASGSAFTLDHSTTVKAKALRTGWEPSGTAIASYVLTLGTVAAPTMNPPAGSYPGPQSVTLSSATAGATIRYTLDGTPPGPSSKVYGSPIVVATPLTVKARAFKGDWAPSATTTASYSIDEGTVATPWFSPGGGVYAAAQSVTVTCATPGATIHYTTNGLAPTEGDPEIANGAAIPIGRPERLKARAWKAGLDPSPVRTADYWIVGSVDGGGRYSVAVAGSGQVWAWGKNDQGQLGDGTNQTRYAPVAVLSGVRSVSAGAAHTLAAMSDGTVRAWGDNSRGQLGSGTGPDSWTPVAVPGLTDVIAVSAGDDHSLALKSDGTVWAWGGNSHGQLGDSTMDDRAAPALVVGLIGIERISAGTYFSLALKTDGVAGGQVWAWGKNDVGQTNGVDSVSLVPELAIDDSVDIAAGGQHALALKLDGRVWAWGANGNGQLGNGTDDPSEPSEVLDLFATTAISAGANHSNALHPLGLLPGGVWSWGANGYTTGILGNGIGGEERDRPVQTLVADALQVAAGDAHTLALRHDGSVWAWGANDFGQCGDTAGAAIPRPVSGVSLVSSGGLAGDPDGDGLQSWDELRFGTDPFLADSNGDGISDSLSLTSGIDPTNADHDLDGVTNADELARGTDPFRADTDGDGTLDGADCFPLNPSLSACPPPDPEDHTPPVITLTEPPNATPLP